MRGHPKTYFLIILVLTAIFTLGRQVTDRVKENCPKNKVNLVGPAISIASSGTTLVALTLLTAKCSAQSLYPITNEPPLLRQKYFFQKLMLSDIIGNTLTTIFFNDGMWQLAIVSFQLTISNVDFSDRKKECSFLIGLLSSVIFSEMLLSSEIRVETFLYLGLVFLPAICNEMSKTYQSKISDAIDRLTALAFQGWFRH